VGFSALAIRSKAIPEHKIAINLRELLTAAISFGVSFKLIVYQSVVAPRL
jgi:hypothetical protein